MTSSLRLMPAKNRLLLLNILFCLLAFFPFNYLGLNYGVKFALLAVSIGLYFFMSWSGVAELVSSSIRLQKVLFFIIILYTGFAFIGHQLFLTEYPVPEVFPKILFFILFCGWLSFPAIALLYLTDVWRKKLAARPKAIAPTAQYSLVKLYSFFFGIIAVCWSLYLIGFFPANMSPDSFDEWKQAQHISPLSESPHPVFYTLIIRALTSIWLSPAIVAAFQVIFMAAVCSSFLVFLYKAGLPFKWLLVLDILIAIMPANGIMVVVIWKDILYCGAIVWLTLALAEILTDTYIFNRRFTLVCLTLSLIGVALLRHNGAFVSFSVSAVMIYWAIKHKQKGMVMAIASFLLVFFTYKKVMMPYWLKVTPAPAGYQLTPPVHGIASVMVYNGELSGETKQVMEKVLTVDVWKSHYNPYSADEYMYESTPTFVSDLSKIPTSKVVSLYASTFIHNPFLIIKDRLCGTELLWNSFQGEGSSNYSYLPMIEENDLGLKQQDNGLKNVLMKLVNFTGRALDPVSRRAGIFNVLFLLLFLYVIKQRLRFGLLFLPLFAANLSLLMGMTFQSFRYVYYIPLLFGFVLLLAISDIISKTSTLKSSTNIK